MSNAVGDFETSTLAPMELAGGLWLHALQTLSSDEKKEIQEIQNTYSSHGFFPKDVGDLICTTRDIQMECDRKGYTVDLFGKQIILRDVAEKIMIWINRFKSNSETAGNYAPGNASLPWAAVRFLLQVLLSWPPVFRENEC